jgi:flagellar hook protein FlgE
MLRSLFSGISSLRAHQVMLDVTGNNIANVNTTGFKAGRTHFQDTLSQLIEAGAAPQIPAGGTNPAQVGLGVQVAAITNDYSPGAAQQTGRSLDMMISGDGFFIVSKDGEQLYTRAGSFSVDAAGNVVTTDGAMVMGWPADVTGGVDVNSPMTSMRLPVALVMGSQATANASFRGNLPADADPATTSLTRSIEVFDSLGNPHRLDVVYTVDDPAVPSWTASASVDGGTATTSTITFDPATGQTTGTASMTVTVDGAPVAVDFSALTGFAGLTTVEADLQDGQAAGYLRSFSLGPDGTLTGSFTNGLKQAIGMVGLAVFTNAAGLEKAGESTLRTTVNSGEAQVGTAGTGGRGGLQGGALEMSNVDLSQEFTNLIIAQRGFQAGSRVITTSDELLQELVNLKR